MMLSIAVMLPALLVPAASTIAGPSCRPSFVSIPKLQAEYFEGYSQLTASAIVIACAEVLTDLSADEVSTIRTGLNKMMADEKLALFSKKEDRQFRERVVTRINALIGRDVATDVFFFDINYAEGQ